MSTRTAVVTGGVRGIGAATSIALAQSGARVLATYRSDAAAATTFADRVNADTAGTVDVLPYDLTAPAGEPDSAETLLECLRERGDIVDILVVNAAAPYPKVGLIDLAADALMTKVSADVGALHRLLVALAPPMVARGFGRIVIVGSTHSLGPTAPGMAANGIAKAAVAGYLNFAIDELTGPGVTINLVEPGFIETDASAHLPEQVRGALTALTPSARTGRPDDVAAVISWLTQDAAGFVNGTRIPVSGGLNVPTPVARILSAPAPTGA